MDLAQPTDFLPPKRELYERRGVLSFKDEIVRPIELGSDVTVGAAAGNAIWLKHSSVSPIHAELRSTQEGVWLRDLKSRHGCRINGVQVREGLLPDGAWVSFGEVDTQFRYHGDCAVPVPGHGHFGQLQGTSLVMGRVLDRLSLCAITDGSVLLTGEAGTGKTLAARAIHQHSARSKGSFVAVECSLDEANLQVHLFGAPRLRAWDATRSTGPDWLDSGEFPVVQGSLGAAGGGTLLLREISEMPLSVQSALLDALDERERKATCAAPSGVVGPAGSAATALAGVSNVRIIASTRRDLRELVNAGAFLGALYFRLAQTSVRMPPLRERLDDVPLLARALMGQQSWPRSLDLSRLQSMPWWGNVRELRSFLERAAESDRRGDDPPAPSRKLGGAREGAFLPSLDQPLRAFREKWNEAGERRYLQHLLLQSNDNVAAAARTARVDRTYLYRLIRRHRGE